MSVGQIIQLQPGTTPLRADWAPNSQPPDRWGVIAHTPDPTSYHNVGGRTIIPRARPGGAGIGGSQGFDTRPGVVVIDPVEPGTGEGGLWVDLEQMSKKSSAAASTAAGGDPELAWQLVKAGVGNPQTAGHNFGQPVAAPAFIQPGEPPMQSTTSAAVKPRTRPTAKQPISRALPPTPLEPSNESAVEAATASFDQGALWNMLQLMRQEMQQLRTQVGTPPPWAYTAGSAAAPAPVVVEPTAAVEQPATVEQPAEVVNSQIEILDRMAGMLAELKTVKEAVYPQDVKHPGGHNLPAAETEYVGYDEISMPWLGLETQKPKVQVIFEQRGNIWRTRYHAVVRRGVCLSLIYDSRFDGDQFIPAPTEEGETVRVRVPSQEIDEKVEVFDFHNTIGCLDVINLVISKPAAVDQHGPPLPEDLAEFQETGELRGSL